jgi:hypothetical protein
VVVVVVTRHCIPSRSVEILLLARALDQCQARYDLYSLDNMYPACRTFPNGEEVFSIDSGIWSYRSADVVDLQRIGHSLHASIIRQMFMVYVL